MAEEVGSFPLDQGNRSALRGLEESREEAGRPRRLDDSEEDVRNPGRAQEAAAEEERDVARPERIEDRVELTQESLDQNQALERNRAETQTQQVRQNELVEQDFAEEDVSETSVAERRVESEEALQRNRTEPTPTNSGDGPLSPGQGGSDPEEALNEGFQLGNTQTDPDGAQDFAVRNQIDNPQEAAAATNELDSNPTSRARDLRNETRNSDIADAPEQQTAQIQQRVEAENAEVRGTEEVEVQEDNLTETGANIPESRAEQRAEDAQEAARNEPPLDTPPPEVEQINETQEPLQEAQDTNPLRAPGPSEIRDEPDATAIETERGQNVSSLI